MDLSLALNERIDLQAELDAAVLSATLQLEKRDSIYLEEYVSEWIKTHKSDYIEDVSLDSFAVDFDEKTISASASGITRTTFMQISGFETVSIGVASSTQGLVGSNVEVHIVIDKSPSMLLAATASDQRKLVSDPLLKCQFACHSPDHKVKYKGGGLQMYDYIKKVYNTQLRADVAVDAVDQLLEQVERANSERNHVKVSLYKLGETVTRVLAPTYSTDKAKKYLHDDRQGLTSATSEEATYFDKSLLELERLVGVAGDGVSPDQPKKIVLLLTDGVQSERNWMLAYYNEPTYKKLGWAGVGDSSYSRDYIRLVGPLNPKWCDEIKRNGVKVGVLYTKYTEATNDQGYNLSLAKPISSSLWEKSWGGTLRPDVDKRTASRDYLDYALADCASSSSLFSLAEDVDGIKDGLSDLLKMYLNSNVRITK